MPKLTKIAVIGAGKIASEVHLPLLSQMKDVKVSGIFDVDEGKAERLAKSFGVRTYNSVAHIADDGVMICDICSPPQTHAELVIECTSRGMNCIVEKPMAPTGVEAKKMFEAAEHTGTRVFPIQNLAFTPGMQRARKMIRAGKIGEVVNANIRYYTSFSDHRHKHFLEKNHWINKLEGKVFADHLIHLAYPLVEFIGPVSSVEAIKQDSFVQGSLVKQLEVVASSGRASGGLTLSFGTPVNQFMTEIIGAKGGLRVDGNSQAVVSLRSISDSRSVFNRGLQAMSEVVALSSNLVTTGARLVSGRYKPVIYGHNFLIRRCILALNSDLTYPVDPNCVVESLSFCERVFEQIKSSD